MMNYGFGAPDLCSKYSWPHYTLPEDGDDTLEKRLVEADACSECSVDGLRFYRGHWYMQVEHRCRKCWLRVMQEAK